VPPSFAILAFLRWSRRSWFFFMRAISSSNLHHKKKKIMFSGNVTKPTPEKKRGGGPTYRFFARASRSMSPVGASVSAPVVSSSMICRLRTYARITAASRTISMHGLPSIRRLMRNTRRPSGPTLTSRSRSTEEARLSPGEAAAAGPPVKGTTGDCARLSLRPTR
jgi:hypothetical protein